MKQNEILSDLKTAFDAAPKSSAGFVNHKRGRNLAYRASLELIAAGMPARDAHAAIYAIWKPLDTHFSKIAKDPEFDRLPS